MNSSRIFVRLFVFYHLKSKEFQMVKVCPFINSSRVEKQFRGSFCLCIVVKFVEAVDGLC